MEINQTFLTLENNFCHKVKLIIIPINIIGLEQN